MAENRLGNFLFVTFHRTDDPAAPPAIVRQETMVLARPGVKGAGVLAGGLRGGVGLLSDLL